MCFYLQYEKFKFLTPLLDLIKMHKVDLVNNFEFLNVHMNMYLYFLVTQFCY